MSEKSLHFSSSDAVYVDSPNWPLGHMVMCHMISEKLDALHSMADRIGVARRHFQNKRVPHYDICKAKHKLAVKIGAVELGRYEFVEVRRRIRHNNLAAPAVPTPLGIATSTDGAVAAVVKLP